MNNKYVEIDHHIRYLANRLITYCDIVLVDGIPHCFANNLGCYVPLVDKQDWERFVCQNACANLPPIVANMIGDNIGRAVKHIKREPMFSCDSGRDYGWITCCRPDNGLPVYSVNAVTNVEYNYPMRYETNMVSTYSLKLRYSQGWEMDPTKQMDDFLYTITGGNQNVIRRIWEMLGYLLAPDLGGHVFFVLQGKSDYARTVLLELIRAYFHPFMVSALDIKQIGQKGSLPTLFKSWLNISGNLSNQKLSDKSIDRLLQIVDGQHIVYGEDMIPYRSCCKFIFYADQEIRLPQACPAFEDKMICIPLNHNIDKNAYLLENLLAKRDIIAAKAIFIHYKRLREQGYCFDGETNECKPRIVYTKSAVRKDDYMEHFIDECCQLVPTNIGRCQTEDLYNEYRDFCDRYERPIILDKTAFSRRFFNCMINVYRHELLRSRWRDEETGRNANGFKGVLLLY